MAIVPKPILERVIFFEGRLNPMMANAVAIGSSPEEIAILADKVSAARAAYQQRYDAITAARTATVALRSALAEMSERGAAVIEQVRSKAAVTGDVSVYTLAALPAPAAKTAVGAPGTPTNLKTSIDSLGQLTLTWTCKNPRGSEGTMYEIYRTAAADSEAKYLGTVGKKNFIDKTIPLGATALTYRITAIRSTKRGASAKFNVAFGSNGTKPLPELNLANAA